MFAPPVRHSPRPAEHGNLLATVYLTLVPVIAMIATLFFRSANEVKMHELRKHELRATQKAMSGIEIGRNDVMNSKYTSQRNDRIRTALLQTSASSLRPDPAGSGRFVAFDRTTGRQVLFTSTAQLNVNQRPFRLLRTVDLVDDTSGESDDSEDKVAIYVVDLTGLWHLIECRATAGNVSRTARVVVRERDPFTRYSIFIDQHYQGISDSPKGDIHTNRSLQIFYPGAVFDDFVSARDSFQFLVGASWANTAFNKGYAAPTASITMPNSSDVNSLKNFATGSVYVSNNYKDTQVTFTGANVQIKATLKSNNVVYTLHNGPLPAEGVIFSECNISKLEGELNGRVTVACAAAAGVKITNSIRYIDAQGDPAMLNPLTPALYTHNPAYDGNSALGVISLGPVIYASTVPMTLELHGAIFSSTGNVGLPGITFTADGAACSGYDASFQKLNLNILGSTIAQKRWVGSVVNGAGVVLSGFRDGAIEYDRELLNSPPPHFLEIDRPMFKAVEIVENLVDI